MPVSFARKLAHFIQLSELELKVLQSMPAHVRDVQARTDIVSDGSWADELSLITEGFACRYKLLNDGRRQIMAFLIPGDICDLRALLTGKMDHAVAALNSCRIATISRQKIFDAIEKYPRIELALWRDTMLDAALYRQWLINLGRRAAHQRIAHLLCEIWNSPAGDWPSAGCSLRVAHNTVGPGRRGRAFAGACEQEFETSARRWLDHLSSERSARTRLGATAFGCGVRPCLFATASRAIGFPVELCRSSAE